MKNGSGPVALLVFLTGMFGAALSGSPQAAQESDGDQPRDTLALRAAARLRALHEEADQLVLQQRSVLGQLRQLEVARQIAVVELRQADAAVAEAEAESARIEQDVERIESQRSSIKPVLESRLVEMYKLGRARYARLLLSATDLRQVGQATRTVSALADRDQERVREYERQLVELRIAIDELTAREQVLTEKRAAAVRARAAADRVLAAQTALIREIDQRRDLNAQLTGELLDAQHRLEGTLQTVGDSEAPRSLPIGPFRGALPWPAAGTVQRRTDATVDGAAARPGLEIVAAEGTSVQAVHDGRVAYAGSFDGLGNLVIVDHGMQTFSLYGHLLEFEVAEGTPIAAGQLIGRVGASALGRNSLYFELRVSGRPVDPLPWLIRPR